MAKYDYIFVDESGDPGYSVDQQTGALLSSPSFAMAALHVTDDSYEHIIRHVSAFRYLRRMARELKIPSEKPDFSRLMRPVQELADDDTTVFASVIYLKKEDYGGPYLHPNGPRGQNARRFWNFALRRLLEWHFDANPLVSDRYDLVLDRIEMSRSQQAEIEGYLSRNLRIPAPINVTLASSLYVEALQVVHHIANAYGTEVLSGTTHDSLRFVRALDITAD